MRKTILFLFIIGFIPVCLYAQGKKVTGTVTDVSGSLPGASVYEKGDPENITATNSYGKFTLVLKGTSNTVVVRFVGYAQQEIPLGTKSDITVVMQPVQNSLDEVAVVGFQPSKRITNTGAVSTINASEINTVPTSSVQNTLAGRLPGFTSVQVSGQPGKDASDFFIRGQSSLNTSNQPLILVDDIEYDYSQLQQINVNEIESISILKDAAETAIYGIKGANGVLLVTTKRGKTGAPKFDLRVEGGLQTPTITPKFLDAYQSALLVNQAEINGGVADTSVTFKPADLLAFKNGTDPYGHPNTDWYNKIVRKFTYQANTNLDISGGDQQVKYFISFGAFNQNGDINNFADPQQLVNTNYYYNRYDFRSNLDLKANKNLSVRLDVTTRFGDINQPGPGLNPTNVLYNFQEENPFSAPFINPNGTYAYNNSIFTPGHLPTLNALIANGGYQHTRNTDYNVLLSATENLEAITPGLSLTGRVAYASSESDFKGTNLFQSIQGETGAFPTYYYNPSNLTNPYTKNSLAPYVYSTYNYYGGISTYENTTDVQLFSNYDRTIGDNHFTGLLLLNQNSQVQQSAIEDNYRGISLKLGYDYKQKFLIDFNMAYNGTNAFAKGHQYGLFPAAGVGYVMSKEKYFKDVFGNTFSLFKIRGSIGVVGSDLAPSSGYIFQQIYNASAGNVYSFGQNAKDIPGITEGTQANPLVGWENDRKADLGFDVNMFNDKLTATIDFFRDIRYDEFVVPQAEPAQLGVGAPYINAGKVLNRGIDGQIGYHGSIGAVQYNTNFVFSYAKNKILYQSEATPAYPWLEKTGYPINQPFGYTFVSYYTKADIAAATAYINKHGNNVGDPIAVPAYADSPTDIALLQAGDLRYKDFNGDGVVNQYDEGAIGYPSLPNTTLGLTLQASYKGFSISLLFEGAFNYSYIITGTGIEPFVSQFQPIDLQAWTPATASTAKFPIITENFTSTVNSPGTYPSSYWYVNAYYVRLKSLDIGYQLPAKLLPFHLRNARIYVSAYNLITWDNFSRYQQDPEVQSNTAGDAYVNQRVVNLGVQVGF